MEDAKQSATPYLAADARPSGDARPTIGGSSIQLIALQWQQERPDLDLENFLLAIYFMRLGELVDRAFDRHCQKQYKISGGDMRLLLALRRSGRPYVRRPTDLFRALLMTSGAITKKIDRLQDMGYVERSPDPNHSGGFLVHLTRSGLQIVERAIEHLAKRSVLAPGMTQFNSTERKEGTAFTLGILSALESLGAFSEEPATRRGKRRKE